jgi:galactokinase
VIFFSPPKRFSSQITPVNLSPKVSAAFAERFGGAPAFIVRAPGRVNLIGEHTDYNEGFVLPMAIDRATWIALRPRDDDRVILHSLEHNERAEFDLTTLTKQSRHWSEYPKGVAWALQQAGHQLRGWEGIAACDVPMGAGLSSSASFELAVARAFAAVSSLPWDPAAMAKLAQRAENQWVGVNCGIMDQMISAAGQADHALLIDCRSLATRPVPLPAGAVVVVLDTMTRRGLVESAYNERRAQCETAARQFGVQFLRDVTVAQLTPTTNKRARHVVTENDRTLRAAETRDPVAFGQLMNASHDSLRDDFEVTNHELNVMVDCARRLPGCYGARMTGAGFGGCAVALVAADRAGDFTAAIARDYEAATRRQPQIYVCRAANGAEVVTG